MIVSTDCPVCGAEHRLDYDEGCPRVDYFRDGTGDPGEPPYAEIVSSSCSCIEDGAVDAERIVDITVERESAPAWEE